MDVDGTNYSVVKLFILEMKDVLYNINSCSGSNSNCLSKES